MGPPRLMNSNIHIPERSSKCRIWDPECNRVVNQRISLCKELESFGVDWRGIFVCGWVQRLTLKNRERPLLIGERKFLCN